MSAPLAHRLRGPLAATLIGVSLALAQRVAVSAEDVQTLAVDLDPLITAVADQPSRFAVDVPVAISSERDGQWSESGGVSRWRHSIRVPSAVSLSFLGERIRLPATAQLTVTNGTTTFTYTGAQVLSGRLWSRILRGDTLTLSLTVPTSDRAAAHIELTSMQAGYRSLGRDQRNHPRYEQLRERAAGLSHLVGPVAAGATGTNLGCIVNAKCEETSTNAGPSSSSVALVVQNKYQCSGTLVNNTRADGTPYVLTARHCQDGKAGGGRPSSALDTTVYWNATSACGAVLGDLYDPSIKTQSGATTVLEQQDLWVIRLQMSPVIPNPYFAGFDVSGATLNGGYSAHYALSTKRQLTQWYGSAVPVQLSGAQLGVGYNSDLLGVSSQRGFFGPGASGSALLSPGNLVTGTASLGRENNDGPGSCPLVSPVAPTATTAQAYFTALAPLWLATTDSTSTTGSRTLASLLDPDNTGARTTPGANNLIALSLVPDIGYPQTGTQVNLQWRSGNATSCTASGGIAGDGWSGPKPTQGSQGVTSASAAAATYTLACTYPSGGTNTVSVSVTYFAPIPILNFGARKSSVWAGAPFVLSWQSGVSPCTLTRGRSPLDTAIPVQSGLPAAGSTTITFSEAGTNYFQMVCGTGSPQANATSSVEVMAPVVQLSVNSTERLLGQPISLVWHSIADFCVPSGGAANDGWNLVQRPPDSIYSFPAAVLGTSTYRIRCTSGSVSAEASVVVQVTNSAPSVTLQLSPTSVIVGRTYTITSKSNVDGCNITGIPGHASQSEFIAAEASLQLLAPPTVGTYQMQVTCTSNGVTATSAPVTLQIIPVPPAPEVSFTSSTTSVQVGQSFTLTWSARDAASCNASGTVDGFAGSVGASGTRTLSTSTAGNAHLSLTCTGDGGTTSANVTVNVTAAPSTPPPGAGGGSGSSGGGGRFDWPLLAGIGGLLLARRRRRLQILHGDSR